MNHLRIYILSISTLFFFISCEDDDADHGLTAIAGMDKEVNVGQSVELDASSSIDLTGESLNYSWSFVSTPQESNSQINNPSSGQASFVPDVQGDYVVQLTISNALGEDSDRMRVTAIAAGTIEISGRYDEDLHLIKTTDQEGVADYLMSGDVDIYGKLTIDPGVRIEAMSDRRLRIRDDATIMANGTKENPIIFTGTSETPGFWRGIYFQSNNLENQMTHVHISAAGSDNILGTNPRTAFYIANGRITLNHCVFKENQGYGLAVGGNNSQFPMDECEFFENTAAAMRIESSHIHYIDPLTRFNEQEVRVTGGNVAADTDHTWSMLNNGQYRVDGDIDAYGNITIEEGAVFRFGNDVRMRMRDSSILKIMGTAQNPVIFKGTVELPGAWRGMYLQGTSLENEIRHLHISHAGHSSLLGTFGQAAIGLSSSARYAFSNVTFEDIIGYGIKLNDNSTQIQVEQLFFGQNISQGAIHLLTSHLSAVDGASDFGGNPVAVNGGSLSQNEDVTWEKLSNGSYLFISDNDIYGRVTIAPGTTIEFDNDVRFRVRQEGTLIAEGTPSERITFTRKQGSAAHWKGMLIQSSSTENLMDYVEISYAGNSQLLGASYGQTNLGLDSSARLTLTNSTISNSLGWGVVVRSGATFNESNNTFSGNAQGNINYP